MPDIAVQASFNSGEWSPQLFARVDIAKYRSGAALLRNYFVDYRGGASTRTGTKYILQAYKSSTAVRLIPFQAAFSVGYIIELGDFYARFFFDGSPVLEAPFNIGGATQANPCVISLPQNTATSASPDNSGVSATYAPGDTVTLAGGTFTSAAILGVVSTTLLSIAVNSGGHVAPYGTAYIGYLPGDTITLAGGTASPPAQVRVVTTKVIAVPGVFNSGTGGTPGSAVLTGTTGTGTKFQVNVIIGAGGGISSVGTLVSGGSYTVNPTLTGGSVNQYLEPVTGGGLSGAVLAITMGVGTVTVAVGGNFTANPPGGNMTQLLTSGAGLGATFNTALLGIGSVGINSGGNYSVQPTNPVSQGSTSGSGSGAVFNVVFSAIGVSFVVGDWVFITGVGGMTQLNDRYFSIIAVGSNSVSLGDLEGNPIDSTGYTAYTSGGTIARVYTIATPWAAADLALLKFAQVVNQMILCHPNYATQVLTIIEPTNWTIQPISIGSTAQAPTGVTASTTLGSGQVAYSYVVTSIDATGQESGPSAPVSLLNKADIRTTAGSNQISWTANPNAVRYNVYESDVSYFGVLPAGTEYGFIGQCTGNTFIDSNISPDFSVTPPIAQDPFTGSGIGSIAVSAAGIYTSVPTVSLVGGGPSIPASVVANLQVQGTPTITAGGSGFVVGDTVAFNNGVVLSVTSVSGGAITAWSVVNPGTITAGSTPANPVHQTGTSGSGTGAQATITWGVGSVLILAAGAGYTSTPTVGFSPSGATATATLAPNSNGNPSVPGFFQQRLVLAAPEGAPETFYMSQPGNYFNFDTTLPVQDDNAITGTLVSGALNTIKSLVPSTSGCLILTDKASWIVNGGSSGSAVGPASIVANAQSYIGANDVPPIVANYDVLYVPSKGSGVRDLAFNIYFNVFTGTDISILSSHLFFGFDILEWAWAEQPFYVVWAIRSDGGLLSLTFLKEQDFVGWAHSDTLGSFTSVATVTEVTDAGTVDAVYVVVERTVEGSPLKYIERFAERVFPNGVEDAWCVDAGLQYVGSPATQFTGAEHLAGLTCTGLADGVVIPSFVMPANGEFTLGTAASKVTVGLGFECDLQTLALDLGEPSVQGKVKKIPFADVRVYETLGLSIGASFSSLVPMKDLVVGNVSSMLTGQPSQIVTNLVSGDARTWLDPTYTVPGQYCLRQSAPLPASVLGIFPAFVIGDDSAR